MFVTGGVWGAYRSLHASAVNVFLCAFGLSLIALPLNYFDGTRWINGVIGIFAVIAVVAIATSPRLALVLLGSGVVANPSTPRVGIATVAEVWARFVGSVVLYLSVFFLIASTIEFSRNWAVVPALYLALIIVFLVGPLWGWQTRWAKPIVYVYALVVLIVGFGAMIPGATYVQWIGLDPYAYLGTSLVSEKLYEVQQLQGEQQRTESLKRLEVIQRKIEAGEKLSPKDQGFLRSLSVGGSVVQKTTQVVGSTASVVGGWWDAVFSSDITLALAPPRDPNVFQAQFEPGQVITTGLVAKVGDKFLVTTTAPVVTSGLREHLIVGSIVLRGTVEGELTFKAQQESGTIECRKIAP
jgi:hypothetical protein